MSQEVRQSYLVRELLSVESDGMSPPQLVGSACRLSLRFSSTRRGARLARQLAVQQLTEWTGLPYDSDALRTVEQVTAELASNAVRHGSLPGRDFRLTVALVPRDMVHIEVTDTRPERQPPCPPAGPDLVDGDGEAESGRGLLLVEAYAERWGCVVRDAWTKTVWAQVRLARDAVPLRQPGEKTRELR